MNYHYLQLETIVEYRRDVLLHEAEQERLIKRLSSDTQFATKRPGFSWRNLGLSIHRPPLASQTG
jgi:hypothetical protein